MTHCFFASDLHGQTDRYEKLFDAVARERPGAVFLGGDLLPSGPLPSDADGGPGGDFLSAYLVPRMERLRSELGQAYPRCFFILGNDDPRTEERAFADAAQTGVWEYVHNRRAVLGDHPVYGYACIPPSPFLLKDWERYDVSRYTDPGCVSPEEGIRTVPVSASEIRYGTIEKDLDRLTRNQDLANAILLFHTPPYDTHLDRADLDGKQVDHVPLDVHVGSIAVRRLIEQGRPLLTLHGHVHESARLTGQWRDRIGRTHLFSAAHHGPELALVQFSPGDPAGAARKII